MFKRRATSRSCKTDKQTDTCHWH